MRSEGELDVSMSVYHERLCKKEEAERGDIEGGAGFIMIEYPLG